MKTPIMLAFSVLLLFFHKNAPAQNKFSVSTYEIIDFQQLEGQPQWQQSILKKIAGARWIFSLDDQTFLFTMPNVRNDLYPIRGNFELNNEDIFFSGHARSQIGNTALSMAEISGRIYQQGNRTYLTMSCTVSSSSAAVVYGQKFSSGSTSAYEFTVSLRDYSNSVTPIYSGSNDYRENDAGCS